jgi:hypothetical protein
MSDIQDEAYSEAMDEIERLQQLNSSLTADKRLITEAYRSGVAKLKSLIVRAADALDLISAYYPTNEKRRALITDLRKAAAEPE